MSLKRKDLIREKMILNNKTISLVRLDKFYSLGNLNINNYKLRELNELIANSQSDEIGLVVSPVSTMPNIAGHLARGYGKNLTIYYTKKNNSILEFESNFSDVKLIYKPGMYSVAKSIAKKEFKGDLLFKNESVIYRDVIEDTKCMKFLDGKNIHIIVGSGFTFNSLLIGFEKYNIRPKKITAYRVGMQVNVGSFLYKINLVDLTKIWKYEDEVDMMFNPNYEAKMLKYCASTDNFEDEDFFLII